MRTVPAVKVVTATETVEASLRPRVQDALGSSWERRRRAYSR